MTCIYPKSEYLDNFIKRNFAGVHLPLSCGIELTPKCNLNCVHCYIKNSTTSPVMSKSKIFSLIDQLYDLGCINILFSGGEVLTRSDFVEIYRYTRLKGFSVIVLSNATLLNKETIDAFSEFPILYFSTTMYGYTKETFEKVTQTQGSYDLFMKGIELLKENNIKFELKSVALSINKDEIINMSKFARDLGVSFRYSTYIRVKNNFSKDNIKYQITPEEAFYFDINDESRRNFWKNVALKPHAQPFCNARKAQSYKFLCHAGDQSCWIQSDGTMRVCSKEIKKGFNVLKNGVEKGWKEFIPVIVNQKISSESYYCLKCEYFRYCDQCFADLDSENILDTLPNSFFCKVAKYRHTFCTNLHKQASSSL